MYILQIYRFKHASTVDFLFIYVYIYSFVYFKIRLLITHRWWFVLRWKINQSTGIPFSWITRTKRCRRVSSRSSPAGGSTVALLFLTLLNPEYGSKIVSAVTSWRQRVVHVSICSSAWAGREIFGIYLASFSSSFFLFCPVDMVKLSAELIEQAAQYTNPVRDRELDLRGNEANAELATKLATKLA